MASKRLAAEIESHYPWRPKNRQICSSSVIHGVRKTARSALPPSSMASERESEDSAAKTSLAGTTNVATSIYQPQLNLSIYGSCWAFSTIGAIA
ncbi:unnamed protein product [Rhodiola kirilowii]